MMSVSGNGIPINYLAMLANTHEMLTYTSILYIYIYQAHRNDFGNGRGGGGV